MIKLFSFLLFLSASLNAFANDWIQGKWFFNPAETVKMYRLSGGLDADEQKYVNFMGKSSINITVERLTTQLDKNGPKRPSVIASMNVNGSRAELTIQSLMGDDKVRIFDKMSDTKIKELDSKTFEVVAIYTRSR